jgi:putative nucleotidyltransferase with HDIG domain
MIGATLTIEDIVGRTQDLPTLPAAALKVIQQTYSSETTASQVAEALATDQALAARVLRLSNSAYYGLSRQISALQDAVVVLGMHSVRNLALVASSYPWLSKPLKGYGLGPRQLWTHSFGTAVGAQLVAKRAHLPSADAVFTAGLLHDIGKVVLSVWLEDKISALYSLAVHEGVPFDVAERKVLGFDHTEIGLYVAEQWNLPQPILDAIRYHHDPNAASPTSPVADAVHIGDYLTMMLGFGLGGDGLQYVVYEEALERLRLCADDLDQVTDAFVAAYERYEALFEELQAA